MTSLLPLPKTVTASPIAEFFRQSHGDWHSLRRYYLLPDGKIQNVASFITIHFLERGSNPLRHLAQLHDLNETAMYCGAEIIWRSLDADSEQERSAGSTIIGARGATLYRDRGFATPKPVISQFYFSDPKTLCLQTEYNGSTFEEELKLVGQDYRTRQTIVSRAGKQQMITQYMEMRIQPASN
jgi:hypothetical protein